MATILERSRVDDWTERARKLVRDMRDWRQQAPAGDDFKPVIGAQAQALDAAADALRKVSAALRKVEAQAQDAALVAEIAALDAIINAP